MCWQNESCLSSRSRWNPDEEESGSWQLPWSQGSYWCWWCWFWKSWNLIRPHALDKESELDPRRCGEADRVVQDRAVALHVLLRLASHLGHNSVGTLFAIQAFKYSPFQNTHNLIDDYNFAIIKLTFTSVTKRPALGSAPKWQRYLLWGIFIGLLFYLKGM